MGLRGRTCQEPLSPWQVKEPSDLLFPKPPAITVPQRAVLVRAVTAAFPCKTAVTV